LQTNGLHVRETYCGLTGDAVTAGLRQNHLPDAGRKPHVSDAAVPRFSWLTEELIVADLDVSRAASMAMR